MHLCRVTMDGVVLLARSCSCTLGKVEYGIPDSAQVLALFQIILNTRLVSMTANIGNTYWPVRSSSRRGGGGVKGEGNHYFSQLQVSLYLST